MDWDVENGDVSGGNCFMNSHTIYKANNHNSIYSTNKRDVNFPNLSEMEDTGLHYGIDIDAMLYAFTLNTYSDTEHNNEYSPPLINGKNSP